MYSLVDGTRNQDPISSPAYSLCADARRGRWSFFWGGFKSGPGPVPYRAIMDGRDSVYNSYMVIRLYNHKGWRGG